MKTKKFSKYEVSKSVRVLSEQMLEIDRLIEMLSLGLKTDSDDTIPQVVTYTEAQKTIRGVIKQMREAITWLGSGISELD